MGGLAGMGPDSSALPRNGIIARIVRAIIFALIFGLFLLFLTRRASGW